MGCPQHKLLMTKVTEAYAMHLARTQGVAIQSSYLHCAWCGAYEAPIAPNQEELLARIADLEVRLEAQKNVQVESKGRK